MTASDQLTQLEAQQFNLTQALKAMLEGHWCGEPPSVAAFVLANDPGLTMDACAAPLLAADAPPPPPGYLANYDPNSPQYRQANSWSCSACSLAWVERALGLDPNCYEQCGIDQIGYPDNINATWGLMDGSGAQLQRVLSEHGQNSTHGWWDFDTAYYQYSRSPGCMSGGAWYHWVGVRGVDGAGNLWIANSAPGYDGVWDILSREDFNRLGPFSCIVTTP